MTVASTSRMALPLMALVVTGGIALALAIQHVRREPQADIEAPTAARTAPEPSSGARDQGSAALAAAQAGLSAAAAALAGPSPPSDSKDGVPAFDIARIEPTGEAVIAGRAAPGATVELLRDGELHDRAVADQSGQFAMVPPRLPPGTYGLTLRSRQPDGTQMTSKQSVAVALAPSPNDRPVMAMMTPDKPIAVPSQPAAPKPTSGVVVVEAIEVEPSGKYHMTGRAAPGSTVRLYLNDSFVTSVTAGADERFAITINGGVAPGSYRLRLDETGANSGAVHGRVEVPFNVPDHVITGSTATTPPGQSDVAAAKQPQHAAAVSAVSPDRASAVVVPKIVTATVSHGDSLWRISRITYGVGMRYAAIYRANRKQIRNPNLIYPGQTFVVPTR
jgi:LysM repeat protein